MHLMSTLTRAALDAAGRPGRRITLAGTLALALGSLLGAAAPATARSLTVPMADGRLVDVRVLVDGAATPLYQRAGAWDRHYFQAFRGRNYSLEVRNTTGQRVGVLIAVDGLNVVNGERSRLANGEAMYVLGPYESAVIRGWRTSLDDIRRFVFVDEERSYAERTGQANGDMGWIRVLSFREDRPAWRWDEWNRVRPGRDERAQQGERDDLAPPTAAREKSSDGAPGAPVPASPKLGDAAGGMPRGAEQFRDGARPPAGAGVHARHRLGRAAPRPGARGRVPRRARAGGPHHAPLRVRLRPAGAGHRPPPRPGVGARARRAGFRKAAAVVAST